jgi:glyoxylase-like metal-dependent hydrolase (beta-lactamase superfamily II)
MIASNRVVARIVIRVAGTALAVTVFSLILVSGAGGPTRAATPADVAPIPAAGRGPAIPQDKGYLVREIRDGLYWITDGTYQVMFLTTGRGVIAVDAPPNLAQKYLKAIADVTSERVTHVIYSHAHGDHIGAAGIFPKGAKIIAHKETADLLRRAKDRNRPVPTVTFTKSYTLRVGRQVLVLDYKGVNHEPGNIFIYAPRQKVLMLVDVIFPGWIPFMNLALAKDVPGFIAAHRQALAYPFETFIGGHLTRPGTRQDVRTQMEYVGDVRTNAGKALQTVDFMAIAKETGFENSWLLFDRYLSAVAKACADLTVPAWRGRLAGADVWTASHCKTMAESLRID